MTVLELVALVGPIADCVTVQFAWAWPPAMRWRSSSDSSIIISISTPLSREMRSNLGKVLQFWYPARHINHLKDRNATSKMFNFVDETSAAGLGHHSAKKEGPERQFRARMVENGNHILPTTF